MAIRRRRSVRKRPLRRRGRRVNGVSVGVRGAYPTLPPLGVVRTRRGRRLPVGTKRRFRGSSRTVTKRRRTVGDPGGYIQWAKSSGYKALGRLTQRKVNNANSEVIDFIWKRIGRLDGNGQLFAGHYLNSAATPDEAYRPIWLVDLTSGIVGGTAHFPVTQVWRQLSGTTPRVAFAPHDGQTSTGGLSSAWQRAINGGTTTTNLSLSDTSILKWAEIRADIWGAKEYPCEWTFTLCQLSEDVLPPGTDVDLYDRQAIDWWDQLASKLIYSPSNRQVSNGRRNMMRVLDRRSYIINPTSTTESDTDPHVRSVRLFYKLNRQCRFIWRTSSPVALTDNVDPADGVRYDPITTGDQHATVMPQARVFMMITCKNWRAPVDGYAAMNSANTGSMNLGVYTRWVV